MLQGPNKQAVIVSQVPLIQNGLENIIRHHFSNIDITWCSSSDDLTPALMRRADLLMVDLTGEPAAARVACQQFYALLCEHTKRWIFLVPREIYSIAVELLMRPGCTLLSTAEPVDGIVDAIRQGGKGAELISRTLVPPLWPQDNDLSGLNRIKLTLSERQVLRLLGKGWCINQIAVMLKKSNKTISAQKNSAMRRLALRSNAEMYAWINSVQGMKELNLIASHKEKPEWIAVS